MSPSVFKESFIVKGKYVIYTHNAYFIRIYVRAYTVSVLVSIYFKSETSRC